MRGKSVLGGRCRRGVVTLSTLTIMATTLVVGLPAAGAVSAVSPWKSMTTPYLLGNQTDSELQSVSCPAPSVCIAVGEQNLDSGLARWKPLAEVWKGTWRVSPTPNPATGGASAILSSVSCASPSSCMAVGNINVINGPFAEVWNGSTWTLLSMPSPSSFPNPTIVNQVSCWTTDCLAVGTIEDEAGTFTTFSEVWDGEGWTIDSSSSTGDLQGASCFAPGQCVAVGGTVAQYLDGTWTDEPPLNPDQVGFSRVACQSASSPVTCLAVGGSSAGVHYAAELWNQSTGNWTATAPVPAPTASGPQEFTGVSCPSSTLCVAVGDVADRRRLARR